jgi:hypothetical protein
MDFSFECPRRMYEGREDQECRRVVHAEMTNFAGKLDSSRSELAAGAVVDVESIARTGDRVGCIELTGQ